MSVLTMFETLENRQLLSVALDSASNTVPTDQAHYVSVGHPTTFTQIVNIINGKVVFSNQDSDGSGHLYAYDPVSDSTVLLRDTGLNLSDQLAGTVINDTLYFSGYENGHNKIFRTDGTPDGTAPVPNSSLLDHAIEFKNRLYFQSGGSFSMLDSATDSVQTITQVAPGPFTIMGDELFFAGSNGTYMSASDAAAHPDGRVGYELWMSDGTAQGTHLVKDINPDPPIHAAGSSYPLDLTELNDLLYFTAGNGAQRMLFVTDGTGAGTHAIAPATALRRLGDAIYFISDGALWKTDGTLTVSVTGNKGFNTEIVATNNRLFMAVADESSDACELWTSDGTSAGTVPLKAFKAFNFSLSTNENQNGVTGGGLMYFEADDGVHGLEIWRSDGTIDGTVLVVDTQPGTTGAYPNNLLLDGDKLFFTATTFDPGTAPTRGLWWVSAQSYVPNVVPAPVVTAVSTESVFVSLSNHVLSVKGTTGNDRITIRHKNDDPSILQVVRNGKISNFTFSNVKRISITASNGNDWIDLRDIEIGSTILGGNGNDSVYGSQGNDSIDGGRGDDLLCGMAGNDSITGGIGTDVIRGGEGIDRLFAHIGIDDVNKNKGDLIVNDILG